MVDIVNGLKIVENTVMTTAKHPSSVSSYGDVHKKLVSTYEGLFGGNKLLTDFYANKISEETQWNILKKIFHWIKSNKWIGANIDKQPGKHKIPRYLYHITTRANYESMLKTRSLRTSDPGGLGAGVYMFELQNMIKHYGNHGCYRGLGRLLGQGRLHGGNELVLLKIPTSKLDAGRLAIRNNSALAKKVSSIVDYIGDAAINSKLYKQRKIGLEYIYPHDIDISNVSMIGSAKIKPLTEGDTIRDTEALTIWKKLTQGQPEYKAFETLG